MFHVWASVFDICLTFQAKTNRIELTKSVKFDWIGIISIQDESLHRVLDSSGVFGQLFEEKGGNIKFQFFQIFKISLVFLS